MKTDKCVVNHNRTELEVECLGANLPEFIKVDLSGLTKDSVLHVLDLKMPAGVKPVIHGKINFTVVSVAPPKVAEETEEEAPAPIVPAAETKEKGKKDEKQNKK